MIRVSPAWRGWLPGAIAALFWAFYLAASFGLWGLHFGEGIVRLVSGAVLVGLVIWLVIEGRRRKRQWNREGRYWSEEDYPSDLPPPWSFAKEELDPARPVKGEPHA